MRHIALLLCIILVFGSLSGCLDSNTSPETEESDQNNEQNNQNDDIDDQNQEQNNHSDEETNSPTQPDDTDGDGDRSGQRVNIHGLPWSALMADCDDQLKPSPSKSVISNSCCGEKPRVCSKIQEYSL